MADLAQLRRELGDLLENLEPVQHAVGQAGKGAALETVGRALGSSRRFSGMTRKVALGAGYDIGSPVILNLRPAGLWTLADKGRRRSGVIRPRRRSDARAVLTPRGPRASSTYRPSRGLGVIDDTLKTIERDIERAASDGVGDMIRKAGF